MLQALNTAPSSCRGDPKHDIISLPLLNFATVMNQMQMSNMQAIWYGTPVKVLLHPKGVSTHRLRTASLKGRLRGSPSLTMEPLQSILGQRGIISIMWPTLLLLKLLISHPFVYLAFCSLVWRGHRHKAFGHLAYTTRWRQPGDQIKHNCLFPMPEPGCFIWSFLIWLDY